MKSLELFSGAGGLATGMAQSGFKHIGLLEWNKYACDTLRLNFKKSNIIQQDIRDFNFSQFSEIDIIAGGPPCQPFSMGGKAKGNLDNRDLFPHSIQGIRELQPKAFVFENVKGLLRKSFSQYFNYIILQLNYPKINKEEHESWEKHLARLEKTHTKGSYHGLKYNVTYRLINAANYGVPQKRERVIIVGIRNDLNLKWSFPKETHSQESLLWDKFVTKEYWKRLNVPKNEIEEITPKIERSVEKLKHKYGFFPPSTNPWITIREALADLPDPQSEKNNIADHNFKPGAKSYPGHTGSYIDEPSKTIKAGDHGVPGGENMIRYKNDDVRYFTICEAKRIQTFPDDYEISGSWSEGMRQLGNAVPVALGYIVGNHLLQTLSKRKVNLELKMAI